MSNSSLVSYKKISPNSSNPRNHKIDKITIHHMAGNLTVEQCGNVFASSSRQASSNYGVGSDGRIALYVDEANRAWTSGSRDNDHRAVTIEVANDGGAPDWHVSNKALAALVDLCVDICKRNGIKQLNYTGDKTGNLTRHNMFAATTCPGPYLQGKFPYIAAEVNKRLNPKPEEKPADCTVKMRVLKQGMTGDDVKAMQLLLIGYGFKMENSGKTYGADRSFGPATHNAVVAYQKANGLDPDGEVGPATWSSLTGA